MNEFDFIRERLAPLAAEAPGARGLADDAAVIAPPAGETLVVSADMLVAGVHFRTEDPLDRVAMKALRVNLSDLAAKGAAPIGYFLSVAWPHDADARARDLFVEGLARDQDRYGVALYGGDTTSTPGPMTVAITAFGSAPPATVVGRDGARPGDAVFVTGTIGDAALGLLALTGETPELGAEDVAQLVARYQLPEPRLGAATAVRRARAAIDVSDGLMADAGHVARASGIALALDVEALPLSPAAAAWLAAQPDRDAARVALATGGDDYELLLCGPPDLGAALAAALGVPVTRIGVVREGEGATLSAADGRTLKIPKAGFTHF